MATIYDFSAVDLRGTETSLADFRGKILLVVNTASECGFTPQYEGLQTLYRTFRDQGLVVLGFPCNQFGGQEPGSAADIARFCERTYAVDFPIFAKIDVNGGAAHPLFIWLKAEAPGLLGSHAIKWNFTKFLIDRTGHVAGRFAPTTTPAALRPEIDALL